MHFACIQTDYEDIPNWAGLRHRSAVGITEHTDALAIIVSEETGNFSYARKGQLYSKVSIEELHKVLHWFIRNLASFFFPIISSIIPFHFSRLMEVFAS